MLKKILNQSLGKVTGNHWDKEYKEIIALNTTDKLANITKDYLNNLLAHADNNVPYYHDLFNIIGIKQNDKIDLFKFGQIPILTKEIMRDNLEALISINSGSRKWFYNSSGGSTGEPTRFIQDDMYTKWGNLANYYWYRDLLNIEEPMVKKIILWGSERDLFQGGMGWRSKMFYWLTNSVFLNSYRMTEEDMNRYILRINRFKPDLLRGYAGSIYELCRYAQNKKMNIYTPKVVVTQAETLNSEMRQQIESILRTKVFNFYGSRETMSMAGECRQGNMHIFAFQNYIEILDSNNKPVKEGQEGKVIVTKRYNHKVWK